ncbi:MAG: serine--tRNA ligase [Acidobacteria bacterium]|nr:serine--tRNA ligase [Acidobacteriota bacterium]
MLDFSKIRQNPESVTAALADRGTTFDVDALLRLDEKRRAVIQQVEALQAKRNETSKQIGEVKRAGGDAEEVMAQMRAVGEEIKDLDAGRKAVDEAIAAILETLPNLAHESVPVGPDEAANREERRHGTPHAYDFEIRDHVDIGEALGILDMSRAAKVTGARFSAQFGMGARLERALAAYMIDLHAAAGYTEVLTPFLVSPESMHGTGQLPKFADDAFYIEKDDLYLIPTSEVPLVNLHRDETLDGSALPLKYCGLTPCFRREAGSYGRDTRGLIRVHQFNKVEMVWITDSETSFESLEAITAQAESVLQGLELPYRVMTLSTGDMGFGAAKTYDLEVWLPSQDTYREISSCSNCTDFQARRTGIRYKPAEGGKSRLAHTLNGSGLAVGRTLVALLENHQQADGTVAIPEALRPYLGGLDSITPRA